jgi:hypothetical protein
VDDIHVDEPGPSTVPAPAAQAAHRVRPVPFTDGNQADTELGSDWNPAKDVKAKGKQWADLPSREKDAPTTIEQKTQNPSGSQRNRGVL